MFFVFQEAKIGIGLRPIGETPPIPCLSTVPADPPRQTEPGKKGKFAPVTAIP
jgi:hypothetical protein